MYNLTFQQFRDIVYKFSKFLIQGKFLVIPIYKDIVADTETPVSVFLKLAKDEPYSYLLESAETSLHWGRYSFISYSPSILYKIHNGSTEYTIFGKKEFLSSGKIDNLRDMFNKFYIPDNITKSLPRFYGGFVGYLGYEIVHEIEPTVNKPQYNEFEDIPDVYLMLNNIILIYDHYLNKIKILYLTFVKDKTNLHTIYIEACKKIEKIITKLYTTKCNIENITFPNYELSNRNLLFGFKENIDKKKYKSIVEKTKNYIFSGEVIQCVVSRRISKTTDAEPFNIYRSLRIINPSPYMFYLKFGNLILIGSSPEILARKEKDIVETRPIAGTRPRGKTEEEDNYLQKDLISSEKENAEHIMLVDLARNDIGKIAKFNSISIPEFKIVEKFSHVMHMVTSVKGVLKKSCDMIDVLKATFPAGTVTGAPKVRAMQIISELENTTRGPYAGAVGYFSLSGNMDMAITIRTILYNNKKIYIQTGAGIVADSDPETEYYETVNKSCALSLATKIAEKLPR